MLQCFERKKRVVISNWRIRLYNPVCQYYKIYLRTSHLKIIWVNSTYHFRNVKPLSLYIIIPSMWVIHKMDFVELKRLVNGFVHVGNFWIFDILLFAHWLTSHRAISCRISRRNSTEHKFVLMHTHYLFYFTNLLLIFLIITVSFYSIFILYYRIHYRSNFSYIIYSTPFYVI